MNKQALLHEIEKAETKGIKLPWDLILQIVTLLLQWMQTKQTYTATKDQHTTSDAYRDQTWQQKH